MKRSYINLRHQQYIDIRQPQLRLRNRPTILAQIPQESITRIMNYLRLGEIATLYTSLTFSHKHEESRRSIQNYLIITNRIFSKWEEKQFLDLLIHQMYISSHISLRKIQPYSRQASERTNLSVQWRNFNGNGSEQALNNDRSRLNRCKESIQNDVDRTYVRKNSDRNDYKKREKLIRQKLHCKPRKVYNQDENHSKNGQQITKQGIVYYPTLSTEPPLTINLQPTQIKLKRNPSISQCSSMEESQGSNSRIQFLFQQKMQAFLRTVLMNICQKFSNIGYIQGFNYIAKNMYLTGFDEEEACRYLAYFIERRQLGSLILNNMLGIKKLSYALKVFIFNYVPKVYKHLSKAEVEPQLFCTSWFVTLFSQDFSPDIANKLWHLFVLEGWKIFIKFGVAFLCAYQNQILAKESDQIFSFMRRITEKFNQQCKLKSTMHNRIWERSPRRQDIIWKLMASVEVNGTILNQLCREMNNLQNDSQIQIWRIEQSNKQPYSSRTNLSKKSLSNNSNTNNHYHHQKSTSNLGNSLHSTGVSQLCCDRMVNTEAVHTQNRPQNVFSLCHNVDAYID